MKGGVVLFARSISGQLGTGFVREGNFRGNSPPRGQRGARKLKCTAATTPAGGVTDETDYFRLADNAELTQRQGQAYSQRSESPRFPEESLHLGTRAAVDQVL